MKTVVTILAVLITQYSFGQGQKYAFAEVGGAGVFPSLNFDMRFAKGEREGLGARVGLGHSAAFDRDINLFVMSVGVNYLIGKQRSGLLLGLNTGFILGNPFESDIHKVKGKTILVPEIGYRFRPRNRGVAFHVSYTPVPNAIDDPMWIFGSAGVGYSWK